MAYSTLWHCKMGSDVYETIDDLLLIFSIKPYLIKSKNLSFISLPFFLCFGIYGQVGIYENINLIL